VADTATAGATALAGGAALARAPGLAARAPGLAANLNIGAQPVGQLAAQAGGAIKAHPVRALATAAGAVTGIPIPGSQLGVAGDFVADAVRPAAVAAANTVDQANAAAGKPSHWSRLFPVDNAINGAVDAAEKRTMATLPDTTQQAYADETALMGNKFDAAVTDAYQRSGAQNDEQFQQWLNNNPQEAVQLQAQSDIIQRRQLLHEEAQKLRTPGQQAAAAGATGQVSAQPDAPAPEQAAQADQPDQPPETEQYGVPGGKVGPPLPEQFANAKPEERKQLEDAQAQVAKLPEEDKALATKAVQDPNSEEAVTLRERGAQAALDPANHPDDPPPQDPQGFGAWASDKMEKFQQMDSTSQIAMGLGLGLGLLGLINSLGGEGGMGSFLMSALGLGAAGVVGAGAGMFGDEGVRMYGQGMRALGNLAGMNIPEGEQDLSALMSGSLMAAASGGGNPAEKLKQLEMLTGQPRERMIPLLMAMDPKNIKTQADAQLAYDNAVKMQKQLQGWGVNADRAQALQSTVNNVTTGASNLYNNPTETISNWAGQAANAVGNYFSPKKASHDMGLNVKDIIAAGLAKQAALTAIEKAARCWAGYEPVPGKKPYSNDSCRPVGSKKKKTEAKKEAASSCFKLTEKKPEEVVSGAKPSTEASKEVSVKQPEPAKKEDLRPAGALLPKS